MVVFWALSAGARRRTSNSKSEIQGFLPFDRLRVRMTGVGGATDIDIWGATDICRLASAWGMRGVSGMERFGVAGLSMDDSGEDSFLMRLFWPLWLYGELGERGRRCLRR